MQSPERNNDAVVKSLSPRDENEQERHFIEACMLGALPQTLVKLVPIPLIQIRRTCNNIRTSLFSSPSCNKYIAKSTDPKFLASRESKYGAALIVGLISRFDLPTEIASGNYIAVLNSIYRTYLQIVDSTPEEATISYGDMYVIICTYIGNELSRYKCPDCAGVSFYFDTLPRRNKCPLCLDHTHVPFYRDIVQRKLIKTG